MAIKPYRKEIILMKETRLKKQLLLPVMIIFILISLSACRYSKKDKHKVLLIGLDGAGWNVMHPLIDKGKLPNIKQLMDKGYWGELKTFSPLDSEVIWTSIATGKTPQKHGIINRLMEDPDNGDNVPPTSNMRTTKAIWNILSEKRRKVGVFQYMVTWPAEEVNGVMVSGNIVDLGGIDYFSKDRSYPPFATLCSKQKFENFKLLEKSIFGNIEKEKFPNFWWSVEEIDNFTINIFKHFFKRKDFDFSLLYLRGIDVTSHCFWQYLFPEGFDVPEDDIQRYKEVINNYYLWCDGIIGDILKETDEDTAIFIVSDHGFKTRAKDDYLFTKAEYLLEVCGIKEINKDGEKVILENYPNDPHSFKKNIRIIGDLSGKDFGKIREEAKNVLKSVKVLETGYNIFSNIKDTQAGFLIDAPKSYMIKNPEHHIIINDKKHKISDFLINHIYPGAHSHSGIIIASGKHMASNKEVKSATIYDITPTVLYYMGLSAARDMDGKVLTEAIERNYLEARPVKYIDTYENKKREAAQKPIRSFLDEEKIKEKMRSLGYIN